MDRKTQIAIAAAALFGGGAFRTADGAVLGITGGPDFTAEEIVSFITDGEKATLPVKEPPFEDFDRMAILREEKLPDGPVRSGKPERNGPKNKSLPDRRSRYSGNALRQMRAANGIGSNKLR